MQSSCNIILKESIFSMVKGLYLGTLLEYVNHPSKEFHKEIVWILRAPIFRKTNGCFLQNSVESLEKLSITHVI